MRFPFPAYPSGWYQVAYADELPVEVRAFGRTLALARGADGCPSVDAGWPIVEQDGAVFVHPGGARPAFELPAIDEASSSRFRPHGRFRWRIATHVQEIMENLVDQAHFRAVHRTVSMPATEVATDGAVLRCASRMRMHTPRGDVDACIDGEAHGLGFLLLRFTGIAEARVLSAATPVDEASVDVRFTFWVDADAAPHLVRALVADITGQLEQDIPIWEHKAYRAQPVLCGGDGPIMAFRRWTRQFYPAQ